jgi:hypothetical protein
LGVATTQKDVLQLRQRRVLYRTLAFKNKEKILGVAATQKDVLQHGCEAGTPSIENSCLQVANTKHQIRNNNETMAQKLTRQRGMTEAQLENLQTTTTGDPSGYRWPPTFSS